jgi:MFS family permease
VWATVAAFSTAILLALTPFFVLGASVSEEVYGTDAVYGIATAAWGVGTLTGAVIGSRWRPARPMYTGVVGSLFWPLAIAVFALGPPVVVVYGVMVFSGIGIGLFTVWWETALAQRIPPHLLSRVSAWDWMGSLALMPIGYVLSGPVGAALGEVEVMTVGGVLGALAMALALLPRSTRTLERWEGEASHEGLLPPVAITGAP